jgi:hypothetical protein
MRRLFKEEKWRENGSDNEGDLQRLTEFLHADFEIFVRI